MTKKTMPFVAVIGCGYWGKNLVRNFAEIGSLKAVCDENKETAANYAKQYTVESCSFERILNDTSIDGVAIATPAETHAAAAKKAILAGKHVFVEKPIALEVSDAEELKALADKHNRVLMVGHLLQYHPVFLKLKELVVQGELGRLRHVYSHRLNLGKVRREENILWSFAPHDISMILSLVGSEPEQVSAIGGCYLHSKIADVTTTHMTFPGGENAHVFVSWLHPYKEQKLVVIGDEGMAVFDDTQAWGEKLLIYRHKILWKNGAPVPDKADAQPVPVEQAEPLRQEVMHFIDCIGGKTTCRTDSREAISVLKILHASEQAMVEKRTVSLSTILNFPAKKRPDKYFLHETAFLDGDCEIGEGTKVWHFSHILPRTKLGKNCTVGQNVVIGPDVSVGNDCKIQNNVSLYKGVQLEDGVFCGPSCVFTNVNNPRAEIERKDEFLPTLVKRGATIGANATVVCGSTLGEYSFIAAGAVVTKDVPAFALMAGVPARRIGWVSHSGEVLRANMICPRTGRKYLEVSKNELKEIIGEISNG